MSSIIVHPIQPMNIFCKPALDCLSLRAQTAIYGAQHTTPILKLLYAKANRTLRCTWMCVYRYTLYPWDPENFGGYSLQHVEVQSRTGSRWCNDSTRAVPQSQLDWVVPKTCQNLNEFHRLKIIKGSPTTSSLSPLTNTNINCIFWVPRKYKHPKGWLLTCWIARAVILTEFCSLLVDENRKPTYLEKRTWLCLWPFHWKLLCI